MTCPTGKHAYITPAEAANAVRLIEQRNTRHKKLRYVARRPAQALPLPVLRRVAHRTHETRGEKGVSTSSTARSAPAGLPPTHEPRSPIPFRERVHALVGHSTWREPAQLGGPRDSDIAASLAFGRAGPGDIGPDIAFDMATGHAAHYRRCVLWLGEQLDELATHDRGGYYPARACKAHLAPAALHAYNAIVRGWACPGPPEGIRERDWQELLLFGCLMFEQAAEDALSSAARKARVGA